MTASVLPPPPPPPLAPFGSAPPLLEDDPFREASSLTVSIESVGRRFDIVDGESRSLAEAGPTLRGWTGFLDIDVKDLAGRLLLTYRLGPARRDRWVPYRPQVLGDAAGRTVGTLQSRFVGWKGRQFSLVRPGGETLVVPTISLLRENPLLRGGLTVGTVREGGALCSSYTVRFTGTCNHLHAAGLLIFIGLRAGRTITVGG